QNITVLYISDRKRKQILFFPAGPCNGNKISSFLLRVRIMRPTHPRFKIRQGFAHGFIQLPGILQLKRTQSHNVISYFYCKHTLTSNKNGAAFWQLRDYTCFVITAKYIPAGYVPPHMPRLRRGYSHSTSKECSKHNSVLCLRPK